MRAKTDIKRVKTNIKRVNVQKLANIRTKNDIRKPLLKSGFIW